MAKYECCGMKYQDAQTLTEHMRTTHNLPQFAVALSCCGTNFGESKELSDHVKTGHHIDLTAQT
jgi:hypothetical protein